MFLHDQSTTQALQFFKWKAPTAAVAVLFSVFSVVGVFSNTKDKKMRAITKMRVELKTAQTRVHFSENKCVCFIFTFISKAEPNEAQFSSINFIT